MHKCPVLKVFRLSGSLFSWHLMLFCHEITQTNLKNMFWPDLPPLGMMRHKREMREAGDFIVHLDDLEWDPQSALSGFVR